MKKRMRNSGSSIIALLFLLFLTTGCKEYWCERKKCPDSFTLKVEMNECCFVQKKTSIIVNKFNYFGMDLNQDGVEDVLYDGRVSRVGPNGAIYGKVYVVPENGTYFVTKSATNIKPKAFDFGDEFIPGNENWGDANIFLVSNDPYYANGNNFNPNSTDKDIMIFRIPLENGENVYGYVQVRLNTSASTVEIITWGCQAK